MNTSLLNICNYLPLEKVKNEYMNLLELINKRQSYREYSDTPIERDLIIKCIEAARLAPSACNSQPWKFVIVDNHDLLKDISAAASSIGMNKFASQAPVIIAVVLEKMNFTAKIGSVIKDKEYSLLDIGIAVEHFCLQATELGLGTCILGWFNEKKVKELLDIKNKRVPLLITLGYSNATIRKKSRKDLDKICSWNKY